MNQQISKIQTLAQLFKGVGEQVMFSIMEIGAVPVGTSAEPFHCLLDAFPGSKIIAFELDVKLCEDLNKQAKPGLQFFPIALGRAQEARTLYETRHPMCCSLYEPNEKLLSLYQNFEVAYLTGTSTIQTTTLDIFTKAHNIESVDFIKIDIQGAELDVFQGGVGVLSQLLATVCEVEFIPHYIDQPLFGDVCAFLDKNDIMFHKFLGMAGRTLKPAILQNDINFPSQHIWSDAVFIKNVLSIPTLTPTQLLKLSVLAYLYGSTDLAYFCLQSYDAARGTDLKAALFTL